MSKPAGKADTSGTAYYILFLNRTKTGRKAHAH